MSDTADNELILDLFNQTAATLERLQETFSIVTDADYFYRSREGMEKLDAVSMQLLAVGENLKNIRKRTNNQLFDFYPDVDWSGFIGLRDIIAHAYFNLDPVQIFNICANEVKSLKTAINQIIDKMS